MSNQFDGLQAAAALTGTEIVPMVQSGELVQTTAQDIADLGGAPYKVYTAIISQTGTNDPVATVLENTLGFTISYSRDGAGIYYIDASTQFSPDNDYSKLFIELHSGLTKRAGGPIIISINGLLISDFSWQMGFPNGTGMDRLVLRNINHNSDGSFSYTDAFEGFLQIRIYP